MVKRVIFICTFDPFGYKEYIYQFENKCKEIEALNLNDGTWKIFLNTKGKKGTINPELKEILDYFEGRKTENKTPLVEKIEKVVEEANRDKEWRREVMTLTMKMRDERKAGMREGMEKGIEKGIAKGMEEVAVKLLRQQQPISFIVEITELPEEKVFELKRKIGQENR
ncbi:MAG: Rpn family recombination-promoting nuclease/putative transposase [Eubacterium sp.]